MKKLHDRLPDFLIIGAGKSGTTSLNNYLKQHPQIFIPDKKEPNFFAYELVNREDIVLNKSKCKHYDQSVTKLDDYLKLFRSASDDQIVGETSNMYLYDHVAPQRIKYYIPNAKFIAILRNPVDRLYSRYLHLARENLHHDIELKQIFDKNSIWWERPDLLQEGFYYKNLMNFLKYFSRDQLLIILYDEFKTDQKKVFKNIFTFLGVNSDFHPDTTVYYNKSGFVRNRFLNYFVDGKSPLLQIIKKIAPGIYGKAKRSIRLQKFNYSIKSMNLVRPKLDQNLKNRILNEIYREDIESLQLLIKRDLIRWL